MVDDLAYPSVEQILALHEQIVEEGDATEPGVRSDALLIDGSVWRFHR